MKRLPQCLLIGCFLPFCWLKMMVVHEFGHMLAAWCTGGTVIKVVLHPLAISRTDVNPNPNPLIVVWGGPALGVIIPLVIWVSLKLMHMFALYHFSFFAGFCFIANGAYIAVGSIDRIGDAGEMIRLGTPIWLMWMFGIVTIPIGFWFWHGLGPYFGLGTANGNVDIRAAISCFILLMIILILEFLFSSRI